VGFLGGAASPLRTSCRVSGNVVSSFSGVQGGAPAAERFSCILEAPDGLSYNLILDTKAAGIVLANPPMGALSLPKINRGES